MIEFALVVLAVAGGFLVGWSMATRRAERQMETYDERIHRFLGRDYPNPTDSAGA